jgi:DNA-binding MarR family transcriptional regulator
MDENIGSMLGQVSRLLRRSFDARARGTGVTRPQWQVLSLLFQNSGINQGGLAELLEVEPITLGRMIDRLQDAQMVERRPDPADRRAWRLFLTDKGLGLLEKLKPLALEAYEEALEGVSAEERGAIMEVLGRMRTNLSRRQPADLTENS